MAAYQAIAGGASARWQSVALAALRQREEHFDRIVPKLRRRDAEVHNALESISGVEVVSGYAGTFKWVKFEAGNSKKFALDLARQTGVIVRPGADYGQDGWVRISFGMLESPADLAEALQRLQQFEGWRRAPKWDDDIKLPPRPPRRTARGVARDQHEEEAHPGSAAY
jgi:aspartate/methionine/tyrosine aminotransferase